MSARGDLHYTHDNMIRAVKKICFQNVMVMVVVLLDGKYMYALINAPNDAKAW